MNAPSNHREAFPGFHDILKDHKSKLEDQARLLQESSVAIEEIGEAIEKNRGLSKQKFSSVDEELEVLRAIVTLHEQWIYQLAESRKAHMDSIEFNGNQIGALIDIFSGALNVLERRSA